MSELKLRPVKEKKERRTQEPTRESDVWGTQIQQSRKKVNPNSGRRMANSRERRVGRREGLPSGAPVL